MTGIDRSTDRKMEFFKPKIFVSVANFWEPDVHCKDLGNGKYSLLVGDHQIVIHTTDSQFADQQVDWQLGQSDQAVYLDGICYQGEKRAFNFQHPPDLSLAIGIELLPIDEPISSIASHVLPRRKRFGKPQNNATISIPLSGKN